MKNVIFEHLIVIIQTALKFHWPKIWSLIRLRSISLAIRHREIFWAHLKWPFNHPMPFCPSSIKTTTQQACKKTCKHTNKQSQSPMHSLMCALNACIFALRSKAHGKWKTKSDKLTIILCSNYEMSEKPIKQQEADNAFHFFFFMNKMADRLIVCCEYDCVQAKNGVIAIGICYFFSLHFRVREFIYFFSYFFSFSNIAVVWCRFYSYL